MSVIKSFSVGNGDTFYINHRSDNFTIIDCYLSDENINNAIINEIVDKANQKGIMRFISTHPDEDHIRGLKKLNEKLHIRNFYCVKNEATKKDKSEDFLEYCKLRDSDKAFYIYKGCSRKWMNEKSDERGSAGINILWPNPNNVHYKEQLEIVKSGGSPNNISPIIKYSLEGGSTAIWMGDLETSFVDLVCKEINFPKSDILFAPHHGRDSGKLSKKILLEIHPKVIVIGEAPSDNICYYCDYNTLTQNTAGDIVFDLSNGYVDIYASNEKYNVDFLEDRQKSNSSYGYYLGSFETFKQSP